MQKREEYDLRMCGKNADFAENGKGTTLVVPLRPPKTAASAAEVSF